MWMWQIPWDPRAKNISWIVLHIYFICLCCKQSQIIKYYNIFVFDHFRVFLTSHLVSIIWFPAFQSWGYLDAAEAMDQEFQDAKCMALCSAGAFPGEKPIRGIRFIRYQWNTDMKYIDLWSVEANKSILMDAGCFWVHVRLFQYPGHGMRQATSRLWKCRQQNFHDSEFWNMVFQCAIAILALQISGCKARNFKIWIFLTSQLAWEEVAPLIFWHLTGLANQTYQSFWEEQKSHVKS